MRVKAAWWSCALSVEETAEVLGISPETAKRDWRMAKAWLFNALTERRQG